MSSGYWERVAVRDGAATVVACGAPVAEVIGRLEDGETPGRVAKSLGLGPVELVAALAHDALSDEGHGPALVQTAPRRPKLQPALSEGAWAEVDPRIARPARLALAAGLLQVYDFWDASHEAAQEADDLGESRVSAYWHGIAHRREPDAGNAAYWFRRVGRHALFDPLAEAARTLLETEATGASLAGRLIARSGWDPYAFIDLCTGARSEQMILARKLQRLEMILLLGASIPA
jgi:hypothetical protein